MTADQRFFGLCAMVYGALFLACVFVAGLVTGTRTAWGLALGAMLASFVCFGCQLWGVRRRPTLVALFFSWWFAFGAVLFLLVPYS